MARQVPRFGSLLSAFLLLSVAALLAPSSAQAQLSLTKIEIDPKRADMIFQKSTRQGERVRQVIGNILQARMDGEAPVSLVLLAFRLEDGRVVARHRSEPFPVSSTRPFYPDERLLPDEEFYGLPRVLAHVGPEDIVLASRGVSPSEGTTQIGRTSREHGVHRAAEGLAGATGDLRDRRTRRRPPAARRGERSSRGSVREIGTSRRSIRWRPAPRCCPLVLWPCPCRVHWASPQREGTWWA